MKSLPLLAGGVVLLAGVFAISCRFGPVPDRDRRQRLLLHHFDSATLDRHWSRPASGRGSRNPRNFRGELRPGGSERLRQHWPSGSLCSRRSPDRQAAGPRSAGTDRQRQATRGRRARPPLPGSECVGRAPLQWQLRRQSTHRRSGDPGCARGRQLADCRFAVRRFDRHHFAARSLIDRGAKTASSARY